MGKKSSEQKQAERLSLESAQKQAALAAEAQGLARDKFAAQKRALAPVENFWSTIASGDRNAILSLLTPEITQLTDAANGARRSQSALTPRGGSRVAANANINDSMSRDLNTLVFGARPQAMGQLAGLGQLYGGEGMGLYGQTGNSLTSSSNQSLNLAQFLNSQRSNVMGSLGKLVGAALLGPMLGPVGVALGGKLGGMTGGSSSSAGGGGGGLTGKG